MLKEMEVPDHLTCLLRNLYVGQEVTESDIKQLTGSQLGMEYDKSVYHHPPYLTSMQSTSCEMPGWMNHRLEPILLGEIFNIRYADGTTLRQKVKRTKEPQ